METIEGRIRKIVREELDRAIKKLDQSLERGVTREEMENALREAVVRARTPEREPTSVRAADPPDPRLSPYLDPQEAAEYLRLSEATLANWRSRRNSGRQPNAGPAFIKMGRMIRYKREEVEAYAVRAR